MGKAHATIDIPYTLRTIILPQASSIEMANAARTLQWIQTPPPALATRTAITTSSVAKRGGMSGGREREREESGQPSAKD